MKKLIMMLLLLISCVSLAATKMPTFFLSEKIFENVHFIPHIAPPNIPWLAMDISHKPAEQLYQHLKSYLALDALINRGESHITVITPVEYQNILKPYVTPKQMDQIAQQMHIQNSKFSIVCFGVGQAYSKTNPDKLLSTYFIVVKSPDLIKIRKAIYKLYVKNGGLPSHFDPQHFAPHITIGYTDRDLYEVDGVHKRENACSANIKME